MEELCSRLEIIKNVQEEGVCLEGGKDKLGSFWHPAWRRQDEEPRKGSGPRRI